MFFACGAIDGLPQVSSAKVRAKNWKCELIGQYFLSFSKSGSPWRVSGLRWLVLYGWKCALSALSLFRYFIFFFWKKGKYKYYILFLLWLFWKVLSRQHSKVWEMCVRNEETRGVAPRTALWILWVKICTARSLFFCCFIFFFRRKGDKSSYFCYNRRIIIGSECGSDRCIPYSRIESALQKHYKRQ